METATILHTSDMTKARERFEKGHEGCNKSCNENNEGEACLALSGWYKAEGDKEKASQYHKLAKEKLDKNCAEGDKAYCRVRELRGVK